MTKILEHRAVLTTWRKRLFYVWVVAAALAAIAVLIGGPIASTDGVDGTSAIALISPLAMLVFLVSGVTWLALLVLTHRSPYVDQPPPG